MLGAAAADAQQTPARQTPLPAVGTVAPGFTLPGATRFGLLRNPVSLADFRGKTVVISFFPRARTSGCTAQMEAYRDQYATLFNNGRDVVVISISSDPDTTLASWARDAEFPILFGSDRGGTVQGAYGSYDSGRLDTRALFVVGPDDGSRT
jgi:peroxiredoxin Q/BCP